MTRILSQHGNVIAADFRKRPSVEITSEILFCDDRVCLMRFELVFNGRVIATEHFTI